MDYRKVKGLKDPHPYPSPWRGRSAHGETPAQTKVGVYGA
jgi:hypothetical protein